MPRARITARIGTVEEQIRLAQAGIDAQRGLIEEARLRGLTTGDAETNLTILVTSLSGHLAERERSRAELEALPPP